MAFNARTHAAALEPPAFIDLRGRTHTGVILSTEQMVRVFAAQAQLRPNAPPAEVDALVRWVVSQWFPAKGWRRWLGVSSAAVKAFLALPEPTRAAALTSFITRQLNVMPTPSKGTTTTAQLAAPE